jgi:GNAT superfamily N-acetyltransferase
MPDIIYTQATSVNTTEVIDGLNAYIHEFWGEQPPALMAELRRSHEAYFPQALEKKHCIYWLAKDKEQLAGVGGLIIRSQPGSVKNPSGRIGYVFGMYTMPQYRRQGICSVLLQRLESCAKELNIGMIELHASADGEPVYVKQGFLKHNEPTYRKFTHVPNA